LAGDLELLREAYRAKNRDQVVNFAFEELTKSLTGYYSEGDMSLVRELAARAS